MKNLTILSKHNKPKILLDLKKLKILTELNKLLNFAFRTISSRKFKILPNHYKLKKSLDLKKLLKYQNSLKA